MKDQKLMNLGVRDFQVLPHHLKDQFHAWLRDEAIEFDSIFHMELTGNSVKIYRYKRNEEGKRYMDHAINAPAQEMVVQHIKRQPPPGIFR